MSTDQTDRTPPQIVGASESPAAALSAFVAQELENWGFDVQGLNGTATLVVTADDVDVRVEFSGFGAMSERTIKQWDRVQALASPSHAPTDTGTVFAVLPGNRMAVSWDRGGQTHPHVSELKKAA